MCKRIKISRLKKKKKTLCQESCQNSLSQKYSFKYVFFPQVKTKRGSENTKQITWSTKVIFTSDFTVSALMLVEHLAQCVGYLCRLFQVCIEEQIWHAKIPGFCSLQALVEPYPELSVFSIRRFPQIWFTLGCYFPTLLRSEDGVL